MKSKINLFNQDLQPPETSLQEVLYTLITKGSVSIVDFRYLSGFRSRVSNLKVKYDLPMISKDAEGINKFGNTFRYVVHILENQNLEFAKKLYRKLQKEELE